MPEHNSKENYLTHLDDISTMSSERYIQSHISIVTDILTEEEALTFPPCKDAKLATEPSLSKMHIIGRLIIIQTYK